MLTLRLNAVLENVDQLGFVDSPSDPFFFTFKVACSDCREPHPKEIAFNAHELVPLSHARGDAHFTLKCKFCGKDGNVTVNSKLEVYTFDSKTKSMVSFDCRGIDLKEFIPKGKFWAQSDESGTKFTVEFEDNEWYDYDEKAEQEVSITDCSWTIIKTK